MQEGEFRVVEDHNFRKGDATKEEISQCIVDILHWFGKSDLEKMPSSSAADLQILSKMVGVSLPYAVEILLTETNRKIWIMEKQLLSVKEIMNELSRKDLLIPEYYIPIAKDLDDNFLLCSNKSLAEFSMVDGEAEVEKLEKNLSCFLEEYRDSLLARKFEFVEDIGVIETSRK